MFETESQVALSFDPSNQHEGGFRASAEYVPDTKGIFGADLIGTARVVPIRLKVFWSEPESLPGVSFELSGGHLDPQLFLVDGTRLEHVPISELRTRVKKKIASALGENGFKYEGLSAGERDQGFLFFELPKKSRIDEDSVVYADEAGQGRVVPIRSSLLHFQYGRRRDGLLGWETMNVGLKP